MNTQNTNQLDVSAIINASVADQVKIQQAVEAAKKAHKDATLLNAIKTKAANTVVSTIQKQTSQALVDAKKLQEDAYKKTLVELGLSAEAYPLESAMIVADQKVAKPVLGFLGKVGRLGANIGNYVKNGVKEGYNAK